MRFADGFLLLSLVILIAVVSAGILTLIAHRAGRQVPSVPPLFWVGAGITAVLLVAQSVVVDAVEDSTEGAMGGLAALDQPLLDWFVANRTGFWTGVALVLAAIGGTAAMSLLTLAATVTLWRTDRREQAVVVALAAAGSGLLVIGFKTLYRRHRPPPIEQVVHYAGHSLPSGHTLGSTVVLGVIAAVAYLNLRSASHRRLVVVAAVVLAFAIGVSRIYLAAHWLTDVLTGWFLGGAWLAVSVTVLAWLRTLDRQDISVR